MKKDETQKVSVRLTEKSAEILDKAHQFGYTTSKFINIAIEKAEPTDDGILNTIVPHILHIQSEMEFETDPELQKRVRKELHGICRILKSCQNRM